MNLLKDTYKKVLVTGGAGFIGSHLVNALVDEGYRVTVIDNLSTGRLTNLEEVKDQVTILEADINDQKALIKGAKGVDLIFHEAAQVSVPLTVNHPIETAMTNDVGTLRVLETARQEKVKKVVLASSCAVYGDDPGLPKNEQMSPKPVSPYAVHKLAGEMYSRLYHDLHGLDTVCLRYFNVFGPRQDPSSPYAGVISIFMAKAISKEPPIIYGDGNQYRDFVFVRDVVKANLLAANRENIGSKIFNIGTGRFIRIHQLWEMICRMNRFHMVPENAPARHGDIHESVASIEYAKSVLGFEPSYSFETGLKMTFDWYKASSLKDRR